MDVHARTSLCFHVKHRHKERFNTEGLQNIKTGLHISVMKNFNSEASISYCRAVKVNTFNL